MCMFRDTSSCLSLSLCYKSLHSESKNQKTTQLKTLNSQIPILIMGWLTLAVSILFALSFLLAPCASDQLTHSKPLQQADDHARFSQPSLPRKLTNLNHEKVKSSSEERSTPNDKFRQASSGTKQHEKEENVMSAAQKGRGSVEEGPNKSEYFTMDYVWVKRRRPIHNKQVPFLP